LLIIITIIIIIIIITIIIIIIIIIITIIITTIILKIRTKTILESKLKRHIQNYPLLAPSLLEYFKKIICNNKQRAQVLNKQGLGELTTIYTNYKVFLYDKFKI
jgi:predicted PurR-regulated permease PerM